MLTRIRSRLTYANIASTLALSIAIGAGGAYAGGLVGTDDLQRGAVTTPKLKKDAVTSAKVRNGSVHSADLNADARTQTIVVSPAAFRPNNPGTTMYFAAHDGAYVASGDSALFAPLTIPAGSTITEIVYSVKDNSSNGDVGLSILEGPLTGQSQAGLPNSAAGTMGVTGLTQLTVTPNEVVPATHSLIVLAQAGNWATEQVALTVKGVKITYTLP